MRIFGRLIVVGLVLFAALQIFRPGIPAKPATAEIQAPQEVKQVLVKNCYSCHSDERRLSWFDQILPGYWLVRHDILTAREHLNFSTLGAKPAAAQKATLYEAVNMVQLGAMPLPQFLRLHPDARVTPQELSLLKAYLAPWTPALQPSTTPQADQAQSVSRIPLTKVHPELNGLPLDPTFESWQPLSFTDRGDNRTFRFILGNIAAVKASQKGDISPWPDGASFAKVAWQQELGPDGLVHPGKFIQVELMVKNAKDYSDTEGWGWGRWRGLDLKPYGKDAHFVNECTSCHQPLRGNDHVYTMPITTAQVTGTEVVNNAAAVANATNLPHQPLTWGAITMYVDPKNRTMATLFGDDAAMDAVEAHRTAPVYPAGAVLALVTWTQRDDPHWFGARIPDRPLSVEFVEAGGQPHYRRFSGNALEEDEGASKNSAERASFLLGLAPAPLP
jgi:mono/diheme cytochrome c family protein